MEDFKIKYKFLHCKNPKAIIEKLYPNEFKNANYANNRMKYLSFLNRVEKDKRWNELAMELGLINCQTITFTNEEKIQELLNEPCWDSKPYLIGMDRAGVERCNGTICRVERRATRTRKRILL